MYVSYLIRNIEEETTNVELTPMDPNEFFKMSWFGDMCALSTNKTET